MHLEKKKKKIDKVWGEATPDPCTASPAVAKALQSFGKHFLENVDGALALWHRYLLSLCLATS